MADGLVALQALVPDLDTGPRVAAVRPQAPEAPRAKGSAAEEKARRSAFGLGLAN